jgi:hypothetical protein
VVRIISHATRACANRFVAASKDSRCRLMSAIGPQQTLAGAAHMSALGHFFYVAHLAADVLVCVRFYRRQHGQR